jgi:hypothetical protein
VTRYGEQPPAAESLPALAEILRQMLASLDS